MSPQTTLLLMVFTLGVLTGLLALTADAHMDDLGRRLQRIEATVWGVQP